MTSRRRACAAVALALPVLLAACNKTANTTTSAAASSTASAPAFPLPSGSATDLADNATGAADPTSTRSTTSASATAASPPNDPTAGPVGGARRADNACSLITEAEAAQAVGADPGAGDEATHNGASSCVYGQSPALVSVNSLLSGGAAVFENLKAKHGVGSLKLLNGIGDEAFTASAGPSASVWFRKGDTLVVVAIVASGGRVPVADAAQTLARLAAGRV